MDDAIIEDLQQEIRYLRHLLDANGIPYDYQLFKESLPAADDGIEFPELTREHAIAFYGMFRGRKDVFAQRSAKKGYHTKCNNFWKYGVCPKRNGEKKNAWSAGNADGQASQKDIYAVWVHPASVHGKGAGGEAGHRPFCVSSFYPSCGC